jgi:hypothetical protein
MITEHGRFALPGNQMTPLNDPERVDNPRWWSPTK